METSKSGNVGVIAGQLYVFAFVPFGFDAFTLAPQKAVALTILLIGALVALAPRGAMSRLRFSVTGLAFFTWWGLSRLWAELDWAWQAETNMWISLTLGMVAAASLLPFEKFMKAFLAAIYFTLWYEWFYCLTRGSARTHEDSGISGWHGTFVHKNELGAFILVAAITIWQFERRKYLSWGAQAALFALLLMSRCTTGWAVILIVAFGHLWLRHHARQGQPVGFTFLITLFASIGVIAAIVQVLLPQFTQKLGKDGSLNSRKELWRNVWLAIKEHPLRGYGPGVWQDKGREPILSINAELDAVASHAHNGFLNLWFLLGIGGLILYFVWFFMTFFAAWRRIDQSPQIAHWAILLSIFMLVFSFSESTTLAQWMVIVAVMQALLGHAPINQLTRSVARARRGKRNIARESGARRRAAPVL